MRDRGIDFPEHFLQYASPEEILGACYWSDAKPSSGPGLLAWKIKQGGVPPKSSVLSEIPIHIEYDDTDLPIYYQAHAEWDTRRGYFPTCREGRLMLTEAKYPVSTIECDKCGWLAGLPHRALTPSVRQQLGLERAAA